MREIADIDAMSPEEKASIVRRLRMDARKLEAMSAASGCVYSAVNKFIRSVGIARAETVVASLVNEDAYDCRICPSVRSWAKGVKDAWGTKAMRELGVSSMMHPARLDRIAYEFVRRAH